MIMKVFAVFDSAVQGYMQPFFSPTTGSAIRALTEAVNDPSHTFAKNQNDYTLFLLGDFDDASGLFNSGPPVHVVACSELVKT
jgi:hypothetical protein